MKKSTIWKSLSVLALLVISFTGVWAQTVTPESGVTLYQNLRNSKSPGADVLSENPDSVALGSTQKYYVMPDANVNPGFAAPFTNVISSFNWTLSGGSGGAGTVNSVGSFPANYKQIIWTANGTVNLNVAEQAAAGQGGCAGAPTSINIEVIPQPTFNITSGSTSSSVCFDAFPTTTVDIPITLITSIKAAAADEELQIKYKINNGTTDVYTSATFETGFKPGANTLSIPVANFGTVAPGTYTITLLAVNDRISRKSVIALNGSLTSGQTATYTLTVLKTPQTGSIYHLPNM